MAARSCCQRNKRRRNNGQQHLAVTQQTRGLNEPVPSTKAGGGNRTRIISLKAEVLPLNYARTSTNQLVKKDPVASVPVHYDHAPPPVSLLTRTDTRPGGSRTRLMLAYGLGDAGTGLAATQLGFYLFPFFTCAAGLPAFIAGSLLTVIKVWDAINDPLIGLMSDHTQSRWGPRLPWMLGAALPLGDQPGGDVVVPDGGIWERTTYYVVMAILLMTAYTSVNLPYASLSTG